MHRDRADRARRECNGLLPDGRDVEIARHRDRAGRRVDRSGPVGGERRLQIEGRGADRFVTGHRERRARLREAEVSSCVDGARERSGEGRGTAGPEHGDKGRTGNGDGDRARRSHVGVRADGRECKRAARRDSGTECAEHPAPPRPTRTPSCDIHAALPTLRPVHDDRGSPSSCTSYALVAIGANGTIWKFGARARHRGWGS